MAYLSDVVGKPVIDVEGENIGKVAEILALLTQGMPHPRVTAVQVKHKKNLTLIPIADVAALIAPIVPLNKKIEDIQPYTPKDGEIFLARDILDKLIIDINGVRVVRVNDLEVTRVNGDYFIANIDVGVGGLFRRLGVGNPGKKKNAKAEKQGVISWDSVELLSTDEPMRLKVPQEKLAELHPADLADILEDMDRLESGRFANRLEISQLADTLEEVETDFQAHIIEDMPDEKLADVLEEMAPDEAADLLAELPKDRSENLLGLMEVDEAKDVRKLLAYPEESAGGIMTTEYVSIPPKLNAEEAIAAVRAVGDEVEQVFYVYVTDEDNHLIGVFSLSDLIFANPKTPIMDFMHRRVAAVDLYDPQEEVARVIAKYNLLAVPVVDNDNHLHGIVTSDDALDKIIPTAWKKHLPHFYLK
jgi:magnesium transporter